MPIDGTQPDMPPDSPSPDFLAGSSMTPADTVGLYVHVPFCRAKCGYCDFYSHVGGSEAFEPLVEALLIELNRRVLGPGLAVETIFIGGGTPTVLPAELLGRLLAGLRQAADAHSSSLAELEFTIEANPATIDDAKAAVLARWGVNRVSMGAQSFDADELAVLDRQHHPADVAASLEILRRVGLTRFNLDLIFGVPGQTVESWLRSLRAAIELGPEHLSCYGLTYESGTPLSHRREIGQVEPVDEDTEAQMYLATMDTLEAAGYRQYELSNYAWPGCECQHNLRYWHNRPSIGIGPAAASYIGDRQSRNMQRWRNVSDTAEYVRLIQQGSSPAVDVEELSPTQRAGELAMLNLRLVEGIRREPFERATGFDPMKLFAEPIQTHTVAGLLVVDDDRIALTRHGRLLADAVMADFLRPS